MMILPIALVFALNMLGTHGQGDEATRGQCQWYDFGCQWDRLVDHLIDNCHCVRIHQCYQGDISNQRSCVNHFNDVVPDYVCCRNPVRLTTIRPPTRRPTNFPAQRPSFLDPTNRPSQRPEASTQGPPKTSTKIPARIPPSKPSTQVPSQTSTQITITTPPTQIRPSSSQPQSQDTSQPTHFTNTDCMHTCMPLRECYDEDVESDVQHKQGSCPNSNDVCCQGLVKPLTVPQSQKPKPTRKPTQGQTLGSSPQSQSPIPAQTSPSTDKNCTCTPFYKCYDEETSSNLTGVVNDRRFNPNTDQESCPDPNDICCQNLDKITAKPTIDSSSEDCTGSCVFIKECPYFLNKLNEAQSGNKDAVQELRKSVCSNTNGNLSVCCPSNGSLPCQFPFIYKQVTYSKCTNEDDPHGDFWCSTQTDNQSNHVKDQWRPCTSDEALVAA